MECPSSFLLLRNLCCPDRAHARGMLYLPKVSRILCAYLGVDCAALSVRKKKYCEAAARRKFSGGVSKQLCYLPVYYLCNKAKRTLYWLYVRNAEKPRNYLYISRLASPRNAESAAAVGCELISSNIANIMFDNSIAGLCGWTLSPHIVIIFDTFPLAWHTSCHTSWLT